MATWYGSVMQLSLCCVVYVWCPALADVVAVARWEFPSLHLSLNNGSQLSLDLELQWPAIEPYHVSIVLSTSLNCSVDLECWPSCPARSCLDIHHVPLPMPLPIPCHHDILPPNHLQGYIIYTTYLCNKLRLSFALLAECVFLMERVFGVNRMLCSLVCLLCLLHLRIPLRLSLSAPVLSAL